MLAAPSRRAGVFIDESWFVLWPRQAESWARRRRPLAIPKNKSWRHQDRPPSCALYAGMDVASHEVSAQWRPTWNQEETWAHLQGVIEGYAQAGTRYLVVFWDNGPWHTAGSIARRIAAHNRQAKQEGGVRVKLFYLPVKAPWLMPLEPVFGQTKRAVGTKGRRNLAELQAAVDHRLYRRNARVRNHPPHPMARQSA